MMVQGICQSVPGCATINSELSGIGIMFNRFLFVGALLLLPGLALAQAPTQTTSASTAMTAAPQTGPGSAIQGVWVTPDSKSHVRIYRTSDGTFNGKIIWLKEPAYPSNYKNRALAGKAKVDIHNPDKSQRSRPVLGLDVLRHFKYVPSKDSWHDGSCYDPEDGKSYTCTMWFEKDDHGEKVLKVRGYVWIFHKTQTWHRYTPTPPANSSSMTMQPGQ